MSACGKFYIKNTTRQKTYCSRRCGMGRTALSATQNSPLPSLCEIALNCPGYCLMRWIIVLPWRQRNIRECNVGEIHNLKR